MKGRNPPICAYLWHGREAKVQTHVDLRNCSYDYVYGDMLGFARLARASLIVDAMVACPPNRPMLLLLLMALWLLAKLLYMKLP